MRLIEVRVTRGATINLGDYESARVEIAVAATIAEGETFENAYHELDTLLSHQIIDEAARLKGTAKGKSPRRFVEGA